MTKFDLVIFDLDGTLVDSERMAERVLAQTASQIAGKFIDPDEIRDRFRGRHLSYIFQAWEEEYGPEIVAQTRPLLAPAYEKAVRTELQSSAGTKEALRGLSTVKLCVASNGEQEMVRLSLECTGLLEYFDDNVFTAELVKRPKPFPDLFLHAAEAMSCDPARTVVIEDSILGVQAAIAAGMTVIGYTGNHPETAAELTGLTEAVVTHMDQLPSLILA